MRSWITTTIFQTTATVARLAVKERSDNLAEQIVILGNPISLASSITGPGMSTPELFDVKNNNILSNILQNSSQHTGLFTNKMYSRMSLYR